MRHQRHKRSFGITVEHRKAMLANMVTSLVRHHRITTTLAKAREASKMADQMVTLAKRNTLHARRQIIASLRSPEAASKLMEDFAPLFKKIQGGYTRVIRHKRRAGDNAQLAILEFTHFPEIKAPVKEPKKEKTPKDKGGDAPATTEKRPAKKEKKEGLLGSLKKIGKK